MPDKPIPFPTLPSPEQSNVEATHHSRIILSIGGRRFALDLASTVTELPPKGGEIVPITSKSAGKQRKQGPAGSKSG